MNRNVKYILTVLLLVIIFLYLFLGKFEDDSQNDNEMSIFHKVELIQVIDHIHKNPIVYTFKGNKKSLLVESLSTIFYKNNTATEADVNHPLYSIYIKQKKLNMNTPIIIYDNAVSLHNRTISLSNEDYRKISHEIERLLYRKKMSSNPKPKSLSLR